MYSLAKKLASKSEHKQHHHACIITKGGKIIATGYNHKYMHAEMDALRKVTTKALRNGRVQKGLVLYSFRWRKGGGFGNAMPCKMCQYRMFEVTREWLVIDAVYYTNEKGELVKL